MPDKKITDERSRLCSDSAQVSLLDKKLSGLTALLSRAGVMELIAKSFDFADRTITDCIIEYVRYKPSTNCIVTYELISKEANSDKKVSEWFYGKVFLAEDYDEAAQKSTSYQNDKIKGQASVLLCPDEKIIIYRFPHDSKLPGLRLYTDARKFVRTLHHSFELFPRDKYRISDSRLQSEVIRYKPEKRSVIRFDTKVTDKQSGEKQKLRFYARNFADQRGRLVYDMMQAIYIASAGNDRFLTAQPLAYIEGKNSLIVANLPGQPILNYLFAFDRNNIISQVAILLVTLHQLPLAPPNPVPTVNYLAEADSTGQMLGLLIPSCKTDVDRIMDCLNKLLSVAEFQKRVPVHGDFYHEQLLYDGDRIGLLDFDRVHFGPPLLDVGNFCAHLLYLQIKYGDFNARLAIDKFISSYCDKSRSGYTAEDFVGWIAYGLFQLAIKPFRLNQPFWENEVLNLLTEVRKLLKL